MHIVVTSAMTTSMVNNVAAKNRRPQKDPPENLADHSRLAESTSQYAAGKSHENHNWYLEEKGHHHQAGSIFGTNFRPSYIKSESDSKADAIGWI